MKHKILSTKALQKDYINGNNTTSVLKDIDLEIYDGDFTVIMGPSGSGKSTLLYCLSGIDSVTSGKVWFNDKEISGLGEKEIAALLAGEFGFVFQQMHLVSNLTLFENIAVAGYHSKKYKSSEVNSRTEELLKKVNLTEQQNNLPSQCSGGEQQRAAVARALIKKPKLVLTDEPTGLLNQSNSQQVLDLLTQVNSAGQSVLMVTHDVKSAIRASRILYLEDGNIRGELKLPSYSADDKKSREAKVSEWLNKMMW